MHNNSNLFTYTHIDNKSPKTLFLLHGTGGSENEFLFLDKLLNRKYNLIGVRGNILEGGMRRFFRRISDGVFDQENIKDESLKMKRFIESLITTHNLSVSNCYFLGYSNGANMILACLFYYPELIKNMLLLHPMLPFVPHQDMFTLSSHKAFLSYGKHDTMISLDETEKVINNLKSIDIKLTVKEYPFGHEISQKEFEDLIAYLIT